MTEKEFSKIILRVKKRGRNYTPAVLPANISRGEVGQCFDTCLLSALRGEGRYVEGIARDPMKPNEWILHAWLTDGTNAFDPTWQAFKDEKDIPIPTEYLGIEMDAEKVARFVQKTGYCCVIRNYWRLPKIAAEILK